MSGLIVIAVLAGLLLLALEPARRRARTPWVPGRDTRVDRDAARLQRDLEAAEALAPPPLRAARPARGRGRQFSAAPLRRRRVRASSASI